MIAPANHPRQDAPPFPEAAMDPSFLPAWRLAERTRAGELGCRELTDHMIARIERLDPKLNAVVVRDF